MDCNVFYRISSKSYPKEKLPGATKMRCLDNFLRIFGPKLIVIADHCTPELLAELKTRNLNIFETALGNSGSFRYALNMATTLNPESLIYFVEDDYLHLPIAAELIPEAIPFADYVTLYDHPDKYGPLYDGGEISKIFKTKNAHWRFTQSTTMTFAAQVKTLREDYSYWLEATKNAHPFDHEVFVDLGLTQKRTLAVCVPGASCHVDLTYSAAVGYNTIEEWAMKMMMVEILNNLELQAKQEATAFVKSMQASGMTLLQQLACLELSVKE